MIAKWGFGSMVARLTSWRNPFHVVSRKQLYESRIFGYPEETPGDPADEVRLASRSRQAKAILPTCPLILPLQASRCAAAIRRCG